MKLAKYIDHTLLAADATEDQVDKTIAEAIQYDFASVCINPYWVKHTAAGLKNSDVNTCTVIGFPLGATSTESKVFEAQQAIKDGADELDMVINIGELKANHNDAVLADIKALADAVHAEKKLLKVIIETSLLDHDEKVRACELSEKAGADFVKTSTGFSTAGPPSTCQACRSSFPSKYPKFSSRNAVSMVASETAPGLTAKMYLAVFCALGASLE